MRDCHSRDPSSILGYCILFHSNYHLEITSYTGMFMFVSLRLCSSHLLLSARILYVFYSMCSFCLCHLYPTPTRHAFIFYSCSTFFRSSQFSGGVFVLRPRTRYAST